MLDLFRWQPILDAIAGRRCCYVANTTTGNWGDRLIDLGTTRFLSAAGVHFARVEESHVSFTRRDDYDVVLLFGSGSFGSRCSDVAMRRRRIMDHFRLPAILLPSSAWDCWEPFGESDHVFVRDHVSYLICRDAYRQLGVVPDLAEAAAIAVTTPVAECGILLRCDSAGLYPDSAVLDPVTAESLASYLATIAAFRRVFTDRLHVAIAAVVMGREVAVVPCRWHKIRGYYETWWSTDDAGVQLLDRPPT